MNQSMYYNVIVSITDSSGKKPKVNRELYVVSAVSVTDAEKKVHDKFKSTSLEFEVSSVKKSKIVEVIQ